MHILHELHPDTIRALCRGDQAPGDDEASKGGLVLMRVLHVACVAPQSTLLCEGEECSSSSHPRKRAGHATGFIT